MKTKNPKIGDVFMVNFSGEDHEQVGLRPAVVVQNNTGNKYSPNIIVVPLTSKPKKRMVTHVMISSHDSDIRVNSLALCENITCISKQKLQGYLFSLSDEYMAKIAAAILCSVSILPFVNNDMLCSILTESERLNRIA